jgi:GNAT superfamily N-acetyltransferase
MQIRELNAMKLNEFIHSDEFRNMENIPVAYHRAVSHLNNPRLKNEDILLVLAYEENKMVGYLGALPDDIFIKDKSVHVAWLSCLWVHSDMRGKGLAPLLLKKMTDLWAENLLITNYTPIAKKSYDKVGVFTSLKNYHAVRAYLRMNLHQLQILKNPSNKKYLILYKIFDACVNILLECRLIFFNKNKYIKNLITENIQLADKEVESYITELNRNELTRRNISEINWITNFPWLKLSKNDNGEARRYEFSSVAEEFNVLNVKIRNSENNLIGFLMLHIRDKMMQVPYAWFEEKNSGSVAAAIYFYMLKLRLRTLTVSHPLLSRYIMTDNSLFFKKRNLNKGFLITESLKKQIENIEFTELQDGDGDSAFT